VIAIAMLPAAVLVSSVRRPTGRETPLTGSSA